MSNGIITFMGSGFYFISLYWGSLLGYWLCLEMASLVILISFFKHWSMFKRYLAVLLYLLVSGLTSCFLFGGLSVESPEKLILFSFLMKVGVFPFSGWLVFVYCCCSWPVFYVLAIFSKVTLLYLSNLKVFLVWKVPVMVTFMAISFLLWGLKVNLKSYLAYSGVGSSMLLLVICCKSQVTVSKSLFFFYAVVYGCCSLGFYLMCQKRISFFLTLSVLYFLMAFPFSLMVLYKILAMISSLKLSLLIILFWVMFSVLDQLYLLIYFMEKVST